MKALGKVLGFRTGKPWKMLIAGIYYLLCLVVLWYCMTTPLPVQAGDYDVGIYRLSGLVIVLWMLSPAIFLSETPFRRWLPLFKNRENLASLAGMMVVFLFFAYLFAVVDGLHSQAFKQAFSEYIETAYNVFVEAGTSIP